MKYWGSSRKIIVSPLLIARPISLMETNTKVPHGWNDIDQSTPKRWVSVKYDFLNRKANYTEN